MGGDRNMPMKVAIVGKDISTMESLVDILHDYSSESHQEIEIQQYGQGYAFLKNLSHVFDLVFIETSLEDMDGFDVAKKLKEFDDNAFIIFVSEDGGQAIKGYEMDAGDFLLKPIDKAYLLQKLPRVFLFLKREKEKYRKIMINSENGNLILNSYEIKYIEIINHRLFYHTTKGNYDTYGSLTEIEKILPSIFVRCNHCYLVNLSYVTGINKYTVYIGEDELMISHPKKKEFQEALTKYLSTSGLSLYR